MYLGVIKDKIPRSTTSLKTRHVIRALVCYILEINLFLCVV